MTNSRFLLNLAVISFCALPAVAQTQNQQPKNAPVSFMAPPQASQAEQENFPPQLLEELAAIKAAARPAKVSYLYYVAGADGCGEQVFSTGYADFEHNAAAYREALRKNGGRVPTCKKR